MFFSGQKNHVMFIIVTAGAEPRCVGELGAACCPARAPRVRAVCPVSSQGGSQVWRDLCYLLVLPRAAAAAPSKPDVTLR